MIETQTELENHKQAASDVVREVFSTMLRIDAQPLADITPVPADHPVVGCIHFAGPWKGALLLGCGPQQAAAFAAALVGIEAPDEVNDDVRDAIGEITNMIAGNLKSMFPSGTQLSAHSVVEGKSFTLKVCGGNEAMQLGFDSDRGPFSITLVRMTESRPPAATR